MRSDRRPEQKGNEAASVPRPSNRRRPVAFPAKRGMCRLSAAIDASYCR